MTDLHISLATDEERDACYRLAYEIYCGEMGTLHDEADHARRMVRDEPILRSHLICARVDGEVVGALGILLGSDGGFPEPFASLLGMDRFFPVVPIERMAVGIRFLVTRELRGSPVPLQLIRAAARFQVERGVQMSFGDCQPHLLPLYTSIGFRSYAPTFNQPGFGLMVPLLLAFVDHAHLQAIRSPIRDCFPPGTADAAIAAGISALIPPDPPAQSAQDLAEAVWSELHGMLSRGGSRANLLEGLASEDLDALLEHSHMLQCEQGRQIVVEGQGTRSLYLMIEGTAEVRRHGTVVTTLGPGECFGEIALLLGIKRSADVFAASPSVRVLALSETTLQRLLERRPQLAARFLWNLSRALATRLTAREQ